MNIFMAQIETAKAAIAQGNYPTAYQELMALLRNNQDVPDAYFLLSRIAYDHRNHEKEIEMLVYALAIEPENLRLSAYLARAYVLFGDSLNALKQLKSLEARQLHSPEVCNLVALTYNRLNMYQEAAKYFSKEVALGGTDPNVYFNLASTLKFCGDFDGARGAYEKAIAMKPDFYKAHAALTSLGGISENNNHVARLEQLLANTVNVDDALHIAHSLAKEWEALHNYEAAFHVLAQAKKNKSKQLSLESGYFSDRAAELFQYWQSRNFEQASASKSHGSAGPIFVVGMPRSGTTLVERILSGHSRVATGGELHHFSLSVKQQLSLHSREFIPPGFPKLFDDIDWRRLGKDYLDSTQYLYGDRDFLVDKLPLNIFYAGAILQAIPTARIICLDRNPLDTITSNYRQLFSFADSTFHYSLSLEGTASFYCRFRQMADFWQATYPDHFMKVNYEALVSEPDKGISKMLNFCGLAWEEGCRNIENNKSPVATASAVQVRQPISAKSVGQWQKYDAYLDSVRHILRSAKVDS